MWRSFSVGLIEERRLTLCVSSSIPWMKVLDWRTGKARGRSSNTCLPLHHGLWTPRDELPCSPTAVLPGRDDGLSFLMVSLHKHLLPQVASVGELVTTVRQIRKRRTSGYLGCSFFLPFSALGIGAHAKSRDCVKSREQSAVSWEGSALTMTESTAVHILAWLTSFISNFLCSFGLVLASVLQFTRI